MADSSNDRMHTRKPNQLKALCRKTLSYQKRQMFHNVCCILMCPLMMVAIAAIMGSVITTVLSNAIVAEEKLFCGSEANLTESGWSNNFAPPPFLARSVVPCVLWFGDAYPQNSAIYERNANLTAGAKIDSTYIPPPDGGWISQLSKLATNPQSFDFPSFRLFTRLQQAGWAVVGAKEGLEAALGALPDVGLVSVVDGLALSANATDIVSPAFEASTGLLGAVSQRMFMNFTASGDPKRPLVLSNFRLVPYFERNKAILSTDDIDDILSNHLNAMISDLTAMNKSILMEHPSEETADALQAFQVAAWDVLSQMPYGGMFLDAFEGEEMFVRMVFSYGTDLRVAASTGFPAQGFRLIQTVAQIGQASFRAFGKEDEVSRGTVTQGLRAFPEVKDLVPKLPFGGFVGRVLYPFGVSFLLPIFVIMLVKEKEDRIYIMMKMNGVTSWAYYTTHYITFFVLFFFSTAVFVVTGTIAELDMFTKTSPVVLLLLLFLWGNVQIVLAFLFASLFSKTHIALVLTFLVVLMGVLASMMFDMMYMHVAQPFALNFWPPFAFYRGLGLMNVASYTPGVLPYGVNQLISGTEFHTICVCLAVEIFVFGIIALYCHAVVPTEFGIPRPWHFPVSDFVHWVSPRMETRQGNSAVTTVEVLDEREDDDVREERARVDAARYEKKATIVVSHMKKVFPGGKVAVRDVTFSEEAGVIFGLLGPNGAGKSTLMHILTGLYGSSGGDAWLDGFNIKTEMGSVYNSVGVCPQFDILWDHLTVEEHLYFYTRLKGTAVDCEKDTVDQSLKQVSLEALRTRLSKHLSGGEKRRLSIAIALVGDPAVVFLDEPTTGLDPEVRRLIWNIIQTARKDKTIILTTHSMEEAEALCQRIGIMAKGSLRCIGPPLKLKELYGKGFKISFYSLAEDTERACAFVESILPAGWKKVDAFVTNTAYEFPGSSHAISGLFEQMEMFKGEHGILEWGVSQTTLEDVFLKMISEDDASAK
ncbi:hypothetical protein HDU98_006470 [Podochytrium sp. JEL0797]|nr:hypothetical protein HDU98_006470 [Podochytrium sp. JEL0797]